MVTIRWSASWSVQIMNWASSWFGRKSATAFPTSKQSLSVVDSFCFCSLACKTSLQHGSYLRPPPTVRKQTQFVCHKRWCLVWIHLYALLNTAQVYLLNLVSMTQPQLSPYQPEGRVASVGLPPTFGRGGSKTAKCGTKRADELQRSRKDGFRSV